MVCFCLVPSTSTGIFTNWFFMAYLISPRYCHRFVGYLEEEAVKTYTRCLKVRCAWFPCYYVYVKHKFCTLMHVD